MAKSLPVVWTKHIQDPEKKKNFEQSVRASTTALGRLLEIIEDEERVLESSSFSLKDFDTPSWAYKQAYINGEKSRLKKLKELIDFIKG
jgi:hypothetical protein